MIQLKQNGFISKSFIQEKAVIPAAHYVGGTGGTLRLPKPPYKLEHETVAMVIAHEMAHLRGMKHGAAMQCSRYSWQHGDYKTFYAWANEYPIGVSASKKQLAGAPVDANLDHAKLKHTSEEKLAAKIMTAAS